VSYYTPPPPRPQRTASDRWPPGLASGVEPGPRLGAGGAVALLLLFLAVVVACLAGFLVLRTMRPESPPALLPSFATWTPTVPSVAGAPQPGALTSATVSVDPQQGYINTLVTVSGGGWWPGEPVFVFLRSPAEGNGRGYSYAAAVADDWGRFHAAFAFPNETRWLGQGWADVIARGNRSGQEAVTRLTLTPPTPTATPLPPTARPTLAATDTPLPSPTPSPSATPTPEGSITDWLGQYYAGMSLEGNPLLVRNDPSIEFDWGLGAPGPGLPADRFSARWLRQAHFEAGLYRFTVLVDDGVRVWVDGQLLLDEWHDSSQATYYFDLPLSEGSHALRVDYYENLVEARIAVRWQPVAAPTPTASLPTWTPQPTLQPGETPTPEPEPTAELILQGWWGNYHDNIFLGGEPVLTRLDGELDFDWGSGSPAAGLPADDFSVRWTRLVSWPAGIYRLVLEADDGARLWVDDSLLIDAWPALPGHVYAIETYLPAGEHRLKVEYYEVTLDARIRLSSEVQP